MSSIAAILAGGAVWLIVTRRDHSPFRIPEFELPSMKTVAAAGAVGCAAALVAHAVLEVTAAAVAVGVLASATPVAAEHARRRQRQRTVAEAWPDVLARMRTCVSAGSTLVEAFVEAVASAPPTLSAAGPEVVRSVRYGDGFAAALDRLRGELADPVADRVLVTLASSQRSGGRRVGEVIAALATSVADELRLRRAHEAAMTEAQLTIGVALVAPWTLLALSITSNPQSAASFRSSSGVAVIAIGFATTALGFVLARRSARLSDAPRVFR